MNAETEEILITFNTYSFDNTSQQIKVADKYWGLNKLKSPEEIENFNKS